MTSFIVTASLDVSIWPYAPDTTYNVNPLHSQGPGTYEWVTLLRFVLPTLSGAKSAILSLFQTNAAGYDHNYLAKRLLRTDWEENQATWNVYKTGSAWGTSGAKNTTTDYSTTNAASGAVGSGTGYVPIDVTGIYNDTVGLSLPNLDLVIFTDSPTTSHDQQFSDRFQVGQQPKLDVLLMRACYLHARRDRMDMRGISTHDRLA